MSFRWKYLHDNSFICFCLSDIRSKYCKKMLDIVFFENSIRVKCNRGAKTDKMRTPLENKGNNNCRWSSIREERFCLRLRTNWRVCLLSHFVKFRKEKWKCLFEIHYSGQLVSSEFRFLTETNNWKFNFEFLNILKFNYWKFGDTKIYLDSFNIIWRDWETFSLNIRF